MRWIEVLITGIIFLFGASHLLAAEKAAATLNLLSTSGSGAGEIFNYGITLNDTGSTTIGTFWYGWIPGQDYLKTTPTAESSPSGWGSQLMGSGNSSDGTSILWTANSTGSRLAAGALLSGFNFSTHDDLATVTGQSFSHPSQPTGTSTIYSQGAFSDSGFVLVVGTASVPEPASLGLLIGASGLILGRRPRRLIRD